MITSYRVPARPAVAEIEVKRSRFRADVRRVTSQDEVSEVLAGLRKQFWDAGHHCSAFILDPDGRLERASDDGEPAGTAGAPMLEVLRGAGLSDVLAVVTRWFGGTLLGAGGLVRAYGDAVRAGVEAAGSVQRQLFQVCTIEASAADAGRLEFELRRRAVTVLDVSWAQNATLRVAVPPAEFDRLQASVAELTQGGATATAQEQRWVDTTDLRSRE